MRRLIPMLCLAGACGGSSSSPGSLQGAGGFTPNASVAVQPILPDGGPNQESIAVLITASTPAFNCGYVDAGVPASTTVTGEAYLYLVQSPGLEAGKFTILDTGTFFGTAGVPSGSAALQVFAPSDPATNMDELLANSVSGSVTLTSAGNGGWAGIFTATMALADGGQQTSLSGSFDTTLVCAASF